MKLREPLHVPLENDGIETFSSSLSNLVSFTNFSCETNESKLINCEFEIDSSSDCDLTEQFPFDCDTPEHPTQDPDGVHMITTTPMSNLSNTTVIQLYLPIRHSFPMQRHYH